MKLIRKAVVNGNTLSVVDDSTTPALYASTLSTSHTPTNTTYNMAVGPTDSIRILAAATWAMQRRSGGITGETFRFITEVCPGTNTSCERWPIDLFIAPAHANDKFIIAHELGHAMFDAANEGLEDANDNDADLDGCNTSGQQNSYTAEGHKMNSKEWAAQAYVEGVAHFYSAVAFNADNTETDCDIEKHYGIDWDADGIIQSTESSIFSCEGSPDADVDASDDTGDFCIATGQTNNRGTEYDVLRFLWDLTTDGDVSLATIFEVWDEADPHNWNKTGNGTGGDYPAARLDDAADTVGGITDLHTQWAWWAAVNGAHR